MRIFLALVVVLLIVRMFVRAFVYDRHARRVIFRTVVAMIFVGAIVGGGLLSKEGSRHLRMWERHFPRWHAPWDAWGGQDNRRGSRSVAWAQGRDGERSLPAAEAVPVAEPRKRELLHAPTEPAEDKESQATDAPDSSVVDEAPALQQVPAASSSGEPQRLLADHFDPDVYQSQGAAVRGLTGQVAPAFSRLTATNLEPEVIRVDGKIRQALLIEAVDLLQKAYPGADVMLAGREPVRGDGDRAVDVYFGREAAGGQESARAESDGAVVVLRVDATGRRGAVSRKVLYTDKPWVDDFAGFVSGHGGSWLMAMSREPAVSVAEARDSALADAVGQIEPLVRERMGFAPGPNDIPRIEQMVRVQMREGGLIADRFVQRFERPYGEIYQMALLIDASPARIKEIAGQGDRLVAAQQSRFRRAAVSIAGLIALVSLVYVFLNTATRGYFVWSLRAGAIAVLAGGVFVVLLLV